MYLEWYRKSMLLYKHINNKDIAFELIKKQYSDDKKIKLKVNWWNVSAKGYEFPMNFVEKIVIKTEDWDNWKPITIDDSNYHWGA